MQVFYLEDTYMQNSHIVVLAHTLEDAILLYYSARFPEPGDRDVFSTIILRNVFPILTPTVIMFTEE